MKPESTTNGTQPLIRGISPSDRQKILQIHVPEAAELRGAKDEERQRAIDEVVRIVMPQLVASRKAGMTFTKLQRVLSSSSVKMSIQEVRAAYERFSQELSVSPNEHTQVVR